MSKRNQMADKIDIRQYVPEFYERLYSETNSVTLTADILSKILTDIKSLPMNNWDDLAVLNQEFKTDQVIVSGFKIRQTEFLKSFFRFKGTNSDLQYVLNNLGYDSVIYNDGGFYHRHDGKDQMVDVNGQGMAKACEVEIQVIIDLNSPDYSGFSSQGFGGIKEVIEERINSCSFLAKISVAALVHETYSFPIAEYHEVKVKIPPIEENYFEEYTLPPITYGQLYNNSLKYQGVYKMLDDKKIYGREAQVRFRPLDDYMETRQSYGSPEIGLSINNDNPDATVQLNESVEITKFNSSYDDADNLFQLIEETILLTARLRRYFYETYKTESEVQECIIFRTKHIPINEIPYGQTRNGFLQYLKDAIWKYGSLFSSKKPTIKYETMDNVSVLNPDYNKLHEFVGNVLNLNDSEPWLTVAVNDTFDKVWNNKPTEDASHILSNATEAIEIYTKSAIPIVSELAFQSGNREEVLIKKITYPNYAYEFKNNENKYEQDGLEYGELDNPPNPIVPIVNNSSWAIMTEA